MFNRRIDMLLPRTRRTGTKVLKTRFAAVLAVLALMAGLTERCRPPDNCRVATALPAPHNTAHPARPATAHSTQISAPTRSAADAVSIPITVTDVLNRFVTGLDKRSFRVFEDGVEQAVSSLGARIPTRRLPWSRTAAEIGAHLTGR